MKKFFLRTMIFFTVILSFLTFTSAYGASVSSGNYHLKVNLNNQNVEVFRDGVLLKTIPCSTGIKPGSTMIGKFKVYEKKEKDVWIEEDGSEVNYYYISRFNDKNNNAFHSMIEGNHPLVEEGKKLFAARKPSSMGCVRLTKADAKWIYDLPIDTSVEVLDPSTDMNQKNK